MDVISDQTAAIGVEDPPTTESAPAPDSAGTLPSLPPNLPQSEGAGEAKPPAASDTERDATIDAPPAKIGTEGRSRDPIVRFWRHIRRTLKLALFVLGGAVAYHQYLDQNIQTNINRRETLFSSTATQLDSESEAVCGSAVNTLFGLAFTRTPIETPPSMMAPLINPGKWLLYPPDYRNFDRNTGLFAEFAAARRRQSVRSKTWFPLRF